MTIEFRCGQCNKLLRTSEEKAGASAKCPQCGAQVKVPEAQAPPAGGLFDDDLVVPPELPEPPPRRAPAPSSRPGGTRPCPVCGEQIQATAVRCRFCGEDVGGGRPVPSGFDRGGSLRPHRGTMILVFAILGFVTCPIFAVVAVVMGNADLKEMEAGLMDPSGQGITQAGKIIGLIVSIFWLVIVLLMCLGFVVAAINGN